MESTKTEGRVEITGDCGEEVSPQGKQGKAQSCLRDTPGSLQTVVSGGTLGPSTQGLPGFLRWHPESLEASDDWHLEVPSGEK